MNKQIEKQMNRLQGMLAHKDLVNESISMASVGWHIGHSLLVINSIIKNLEQSDSSTYQKPGFSFVKQLVFTLNWFPRGRAQAPQSVRPVAEITHEYIQDLLKNCQILLAKVDSLPQNAYVKHPIFKVLTTKEAIRFMAIHTKHHANIAQEIIEKS
jgi:hypothetical protein